jgi:hypothetical protein
MCQHFRYDRAPLLRSGFQKGSATIPRVLKPLLIIFLAASTACAQQESKLPEPQVKLNYLNVCAPSEEEQTQMKAALAKIRIPAAFSRDFEISRGQATLQDAPDARFVRYRRDLVSDSPLLAAQYSMSSDSNSIVETLVLRLRDPKDFHEISLEDRVTAGAMPPSALLAVDTPVSRIRIERLGKSSIVLARCQDSDQSAYEPLFREATEIMARYRKSMELGSAIRSDVAWLSSSGKSGSSSHPARATSKGAAEPK